MNNIFEKNITALAQKDIELAKKITSHIITDIPQLIQTNGCYNLIYKNCYLHNQQNPLAEAKEIFFQAENKPIAIHLIYGLGLGYLFQVASMNSQGTVILYEPDLNILKISLTLVDFSQDILKKNVFITDSLTKAEEYIHQKSNMKNIPLLLSTPSYRKINQDNFNTMVEELQRIVGTYNLDLKYTKDYFYILLKLILNNIPKLVTEKPLTTIKDYYKNKTAIIVSAGPTLDRNIETLKKYRDKYVLFVVGTAMKSISKHNIIPDFLCIIEAYDSSKQIADIDLSQVNFITEPYSCPNIRNFKFKNTFSHVSSNLPVNKFWSRTAQIEQSEYISKGTVSYTALNSARILGCSKIILVGQDLAYIEGQCYSKESAYKDLECKYNEENKKWEIAAKNFDEFANNLSNSENPEERRNTAIDRLNRLNSCLYYVKGINGDMIPTESVYAAFIKPLSEFTEKYSNCEYINTSLVGAQIDGFKNIPLEEALQDSNIIENRNIDVDFEYDISKIKNNLKNALTDLRQALDKVYTGQKLIKSFNNELKRYKNVTQELLISLKKVSMFYLELSNNYAKENLLFDLITISDKIEVDYELKMNQEFTTESISNIVNKMSQFYNNAEQRIKEVSEIIDKVIL